MNFSNTLFHRFLLAIFSTSCFGGAKTPTNLKGELTVNLEESFPNSKLPKPPKKLRATGRVRR